MFKAVAVLALVLLARSPAAASARIALLIGNQNYGQNVGRLASPRADIALLGARLEALGFAVTLLRDADYKAMETSIARHAEAVRRAGKLALSFVYYSGHGAADLDAGLNYLIPIDVPNANVAELWPNAIAVSDIIDRLSADAPEAVHFIVLDACRSELRLTKGTAAVAEKGFLAQDSKSGAVVAFATAPGRTVADGGPGGGAYARALAAEIAAPGIEAMALLRKVALRVKREADQDPWLSAPAIPEVYFAREAEGSASGGRIASGASANSEAMAATAWAAARETNDRSVLESFIAHYKGTFYAGLATARLQEWDRQHGAAEAPVEPTSPAAQRARAQEAPAPAELTRRLQLQLRRIGCLDAEPDGKWGQQSRLALRNFARRTGLVVDDDAPNAALLDAATAAPQRVCPLQCAESEVEREGRCVARPRPQREAEPRRSRQSERERPRRAPRAAGEQPSAAPSKLCFGGARTEIVSCR
jgi:carboxyl-terminal processing protease